MFSKWLRTPLRYIFKKNTTKRLRGRAKILYPRRDDAQLKIPAVSFPKSLSPPLKWASVYPREYKYDVPFLMQNLLAIIVLTGTRCNQASAIARTLCGISTLNSVFLEELSVHVEPQSTRAGSVDMTVRKLPYVAPIETHPPPCKSTVEPPTLKRHSTIPTKSSFRLTASSARNVHITTHRGVWHIACHRVRFVPRQCLKGSLRPLREWESTITDDDSGSDGTGLLVWPGSRALASFLAGPSGVRIFCPSDLVANQPGCALDGQRTVVTKVKASSTVLELGAGTGICGMTASLLFCCPVILTDRRNDVLDNLQENIRLNGLASKARVAQLTWGSGAPTKLPSEIREELPFKVGATTGWPGRLRYCRRPRYAGPHMFAIERPGVFSHPLRAFSTFGHGRVFERVVL